MVPGRVELHPEGVELRPWRLQEIKGRPELQNGGLRVLEEVWDDFLLEAFFCQVCSFSVAGSSQAGCRRCGAASLEDLEVRGSPEPHNGGLGALEEVWDDFLLEAFSVKFARFLWFWVVSSWFQKMWS